MTDLREALEAVAAHRRQVAELTDRYNGTPCAEIRWQQERDALIARAEAAELDAERYRFLAGQGSLYGKWSCKADLDASIAAMASVAGDDGMEAGR